MPNLNTYIKNSLVNLSPMSLRGFKLPRVGWHIIVRSILNLEII